ncbi:MAG: glycine cleavage system aminomethyltransferase GcvT [Candidatus Marinimicrobia bacterium]|nr:glycine cleavage system aminomethyltransferase GcvT [Candidatus Neomarinimicrobiota bacterium]
MKRTPLYDSHLKAGGKMVEFAGYEMPVQYAGIGIVEEHRAVRERVGLFDVSHMGEFKVSGSDSLEFLQKMTLNDVSKLEVNQAQYSGICYEDGGMVDDLLVYKFEDHYMLVVNASNIEKDFDWFDSHKPEGVELINESDDTALLALQGKNSKDVLNKLTSLALDDIKYYRFEIGSVSGKEATVSRTGYTGELGFELYLKAEDALEVWNDLMSAGAEFDIKPTGLGARDTLRLEMCYPLYGNDIDQTTNPIEAGLGWITKLNKGDFIGSTLLRQIKENGPSKRLVAFEMERKAIPRHDYEILLDDKIIGKVTSGTFSPTLRIGIGLGYVRAGNHKPETEIKIDIRGRYESAKIIKPPFYKPE